MNANYTKHLWEEQILPHWSHRDRPTGQRFLGSIRIKRTASDQLLDIVGQNLQQLDRVTYNSLHDEFYELEQNWLKVLTFALSEYAYYYSSERFWQGFCERLEIHHNQGVENTLRQVVDEGINLLGLVRATGGYKYVSTLWLQSGVPEQNLGHFAQLVQEIADDYGWWELAHTPAADLSPALLNFCQENHPQWGTLINFLNASYSEDGETEPISGQLLQGIAIVAQELERQGVSPSALQNEHQREELLGSYYLPHNFFLRNWNALIQVLTPKTGSGQSRSLVRRRSQPLVLSLDIIDTGNTQLILPEQTLWKPEWRDLRDTYCQIPEANWENTIPRVGDLEIPELAIDVNQASEDWSCQLLDHNRKSLLKWHYAGITRDFPCLVFDAVTGDHLPLNLPNPTIIGVEEIICFTPKELSLQFANGIEVLDSCIPSSIRGWRGQQIALNQYELPEDTNENEDLANYCYTILDQEPTPNFIEAVKKLNPDFDLQQIQAGIASLEEHGYNFPEWLNPDALVSQLKGLLNVLELPPVQPIQPPDSPPPVEPKEPSAPPPVSGTWYLVNVRHKKRDLFLRCLKAVIEQNKLQDMILAVETPDDSVYEDIVLLNLANFKAARTPIQSIESCQRIEPKPLPPAHVNRMLGAR